MFCNSYIVMTSISCLNLYTDVTKSIPMFNCGEGEVIPMWKTCNNIPDCTDGSDELICGSPEGQLSSVLWLDFTSGNVLFTVLNVKCTILFTMSEMPTLPIWSGGSRKIHQTPADLTIMFKILPIFFFLKF